MKFEEQLKLQALMDGELSGKEAREVEAWLASNLDAQSLVQELNFTRDVLRSNEPEIKAPESREFYWSKIQREILREESAQPQRSPFRQLVLSWRKYLLPLTGIAVVALLAVYSVNVGGVGLKDSLVEVENLSEETESATFHSQAENVVVVWVSSKETAVTEDPAKAEEMIY